MNVNTDVFDDRFIFNDIYTGVENFMGTHINSIRTLGTNDSLRKMFTNFHIRELEIFDDLCKFGKIKGWLPAPPLKHTAD